MSLSADDHRGALSQPALRRACARRAGAVPPGRIGPALTAFLCILGTQVVFWTFTFPANEQTANWTILPDNWAALRRQWEYSHAVSAILDLAALIGVIISVLSGRKP